MAIEIRLEKFEGPLDLLLHLIKTNEMDIYDIPMVEITEQYLAVIDRMKQLNLDIAGEFLLMAATLIHIKSRLLLPVADEPGEEEEEADPRAELVRRLLEYQRYKEVARVLEDSSQLDRDVFVRHFSLPEYLGETDEEGDTVGIYQLTAAFHQLLKEASREVYHEVVREPLSVADHIQLVLGRLRESPRLAFRDVFPQRPARAELVVTFLALLELVKMRMIHLVQAERYGMIWLSLAVPADQRDVPALEEDSFGYG
ncbi:MAG: segregation/condensation protein A [Desulfuromonadales bacterium]|jgi:segregation and condensation protein A|nr:segregation/condensation protein A [Desulfuromonadales bacterium]